MKQILNVKTESGELYSEVVASVIKSPADPEAGANFDEISKTVPVLTKLAGVEVGGNILLENSEHDLVVKRLKETKFAVINATLLTLISAFIDAEDYEVK